MRDEKGFDFKVLCVAVGDPHQAHVERLDQVRPHRLVEIEHFFETYKLLEAKDTRGARLARRGPELTKSSRADHKTYLKGAQEGVSSAGPRRATPNRRRRAGRAPKRQTA